MKITFWRLIPLFVFIVLCIFFWRGLALDPRYLPSAQLNKPLPHFQLSTLDNIQTEFTQKSLRGQVALLNVWASWCAACSYEQYFLLQLAREGMAIYGLNYKDNTEEAKRWLSEWGNPYKIIGQDFNGKVAIDLGVYGAPEMFLIDKKGVIRYRHSGVLDADTWQKEFLPRIKALERQT